jgi:aminomethyltransferase
MSATATSETSLERTPLYDLHVALGARMVPFAGYAMPVQYPQGILKEHLHARVHAGLFDVSHMGQATVVAVDRRHETVARALETLVPADLLNLRPGQQRYTQLLNDDGGIIDDLMVSRPAASEATGVLKLIVNAARKAVDFAHLLQRRPRGVILVQEQGLALIALQGPDAAAVLSQHVPGVAAMRFMTAHAFEFDATIPVDISRSGYTGDDGFELSLLQQHAATVWNALLADARVAPAGLGARDSLRLEAGLCLYGNDIDETTSPVEAGLAWSIGKRARTEGNFPGIARIQRELEHGPARRRVGIRPDGRAPARAGTEIVASSGEAIGTVTSGGFGPSVNGPIAMGYVQSRFAAPGTRVDLMVRGKAMGAAVVALPFVPHRYASVAGVRPAGPGTESTP